MTRWFEPRWNPAGLVPDRLLGGRALNTATVAGRAAAATWGDWPAGPGTPGAATVLVGGAGFLGARIASQLLAEPGEAPVVVVSRRPKILPFHDPRLILVAADITAPNRDWMRFVPRSGTVFHLAAAMHALVGWEALAPVNLLGLGASVALAERDGALLQLASTLSVFVSSNASRADAEEPLPARDDLWLYGGYAQTKAAAEFALARRSGLRWQVIRHGLLVPEAGAAFPPRHFAPMFLRALCRTGAVPEQAERADVDLTPVDGAARESIRLARAGVPRWRHWANRETACLADVVDAVEALRGPFARVPMAEWLDRIRPLPRMERTLLRAAFDKSGFLAGSGAGVLLNVDLFQSTSRCFVPAARGSDVPPPPARLLPGFVQSMLASLEGGA